VGNPADLLQPLFNGVLIEGIGVTFDYPDGILGALPQAGSEPVAEVVGGKSCLAVHNCYGPFGTGGNAETAAIASVFIDLYDFSFHGHCSIYWGDNRNHIIKRNNARDSRVFPGGSFGGRKRPLSHGLLPDTPLNSSEYGNVCRKVSG
jgi:hypothetical protein